MNLQIILFGLSLFHDHVYNFVLFSSCPQLSLSIPNLLLGPGSVGKVLLDLQLSRRVHGLTGSVQRSSITIGSSLSRPFVTYNTGIATTTNSSLISLTSMEDTALSVRSKGSKGTNCDDIIIILLEV